MWPPSFLRSDHRTNHVKRHLAKAASMPTEAEPSMSLLDLEPKLALELGPRSSAAS
ncbi:unnamed protein product, partial [Protopolystoma xenopodis]